MLVGLMSCIGEKCSKFGRQHLKIRGEGEIFRQFLTTTQALMCFLLCSQKVNRSPAFRGMRKIVSRIDISSVPVCLGIFATNLHE